jgi:hypothetical protein
MAQKSTTQTYYIDIKKKLMTDVYIDANHTPAGLMVKGLKNG